MIKKMKTKMTAIFAILMVALMIAGISYAMWSKEIFINGTVNTGKLDAIFEGPYSWNATYLEGNVVTPVPEEKLTEITVTAEPKPDDQETLLVTIDGLYPCITIHIYYNIKNAGTTPWIVDKVTVDFPEGLGFPGTVTVTPPDLVGTQVDAGKSITADLEVHLTNDAVQSGIYFFTVTIHVVQWNEYPAPPAPPE